MDNGILYLCVFISFLALAKHGNCIEIPGNEPTRFTWYDFAKIILERSITAELKVKHMESLLGDMEASRKLQETEVNRLKSEIASERVEMKADVDGVIETANKILERTITAELKVTHMETEVNRLKSEIASERVEMKAEVDGVIETAQDQVARLSRDLGAFQGKVNTSLQLQFEEQGAAGGGAVYIRWGRTVCPDSTTTVYTGIAGGSYYTHKGGQSNPVCLPREPIFSNYQAGFQGSYMHGVEYQSDTGRTEAVFGTNVDNHDVPCAVCEARGRRSKMLVPARNVCYSGWHLEYSGYLMTSQYTHRRTTIECVDANPEGVRGQSGDNNGQLFYFVEAAGQIPEPPYTRGKELTCAICTK